MDGKSILIGIAISVAFSIIYYDKFDGKIQKAIYTSVFTYYKKVVCFSDWNSDWRILKRIPVLPKHLTGKSLKEIKQ